MLILTRKVGESIILAGKVHVQVLSLKGSQVRIGITAPDDIRIRREELLKAPAPVKSESGPLRDRGRKTPSGKPREEVLALARRRFP